ncbi:F-box protein At1g30790-like [Solanum verrucosum]|uniref:F-box protein At1g30790-like n=1 Tax=Solanum verrucosum TaxID=315347 RepID=UPI0020D0A161|nr:F-box protein At1g30790-like [Solanum verrucosum]
MNSAGKIVSIPQEIMFELFSWLPSDSLMRFKCVSRFCNSMVSESDFLDIHRCRSGEIEFLLHGVSAYYTAEEKKKKYGKASTLVLQVDGFDSLYNCVPTDPAYSCLDCVNGLFCDWDSSNMRPAAIFNPSAKEVRFLPDPIESKCWNKYSLGFEPKENKYKVLLTTHLSRERYTKYGVFTLGIDKSWRDIAFDVKSEKIKIIALWIALELVYYYRLIEVKGKLGVIDYRKWVSGYFDLWILEKTPKREWERQIIGVPSIWKTREPRFASFFMDRHGEIVFVVYLSRDQNPKKLHEAKLVGNIAG